MCNYWGQPYLLRKSSNVVQITLFQNAKVTSFDCFWKNKFSVVCFRYYFQKGCLEFLLSKIRLKVLDFKMITRMHSSSMCTAHFNGRLGRGCCSGWGCVCVLGGSQW